VVCKLKWKLLSVVYDGVEILVNGHNLWKYPWIQTSGQPIVIEDPEYRLEHKKIFPYKIDYLGDRIDFAAGELSPNVWAFYIPA